MNATDSVISSCSLDYLEVNTSLPWSPQVSLGDNFSLEMNCRYEVWSTAEPARRKAHYAPMMSLPLQVIWALVFSSMLCTAIGGNTIVIWSVIAHRRMRTVTNYFLVNLSTADLLMSILNCIFNFVYMINNDWNFGRHYCRINNYVANVTVAASVFTLTSITIDRYLAIVTPLKPRMSKARAQVTIIGIWAASLLLGFPCLLYSTTITYKTNGQTACILVWPDGQPMVSTLDYIYNIVLFLVTYLIPMTAMVCCYSAMARELWGSRSIGEMTQRQVESIKSKRKVVRMFVLIVSVFGICWLPYHSYFIYTYHQTDFVYSKYVQHLYLGFYWLAMANAMLNPLIYYCMNARFREYFREAICTWSCHKVGGERLSGVDTPPARRFSHSYSRSGTLQGDDLSGTGFERNNKNRSSFQYKSPKANNQTDWKVNRGLIVTCKTEQLTRGTRGSTHYMAHSWKQKNGTLTCTKAGLSSV